ncbi:MAG: cob(I)yrinic acid a,c-diamide adenosyltransferase [Tessaracoccus sp.]
MVTLSKICTRTGDAGQTRLSDKAPSPTRPICASRPTGTLTSCNSIIGVAIALGGVPERIVEMLGLVRNELFDVGADLSTPLHPSPKWPPLRIEQPSIDRLEGFCDELQEDLTTLRSFILPGGTPSGAQLHVARTVARRAERTAWACYERYGDEPRETDGGVNLLAITYLNRLSDLLFIMARATNGTEAETLWVPGTDREAPKRR